jgi:hypothetical protein
VRLHLAQLIEADGRVRSVFVADPPPPFLHAPDPEHFSGTVSQRYERVFDADGLVYQRVPD